jgi:hypothetical protein
MDTSEPDDRIPSHAAQPVIRRLTRPPISPVAKLDSRLPFDTFEVDNPPNDKRGWEKLLRDHLIKEVFGGNDMALALTCNKVFSI